MAQNSAEKERAPSSKTEEKSPREEETTALVKEENEEKSPEEQERIDKILSSMSESCLLILECMYTRTYTHTLLSKMAHSQIPFSSCFTISSLSFHLNIDVSRSS